jgi:hypothetical protein
MSTVPKTQSSSQPERATPADSKSSHDADTFGETPSGKETHASNNQAAQGLKPKAAGSDAFGDGRKRHVDEDH